MAWLHAGHADLIRPAGRKRLEEAVSCPSRRWSRSSCSTCRTDDAEPADVVLTALAAEIGLGVCDLPFEQVSRAALRQDWTQDPFDRLIVAQAAARDADLLSRDQAIGQSYPRTVW